NKHHTAAQINPAVLLTRRTRANSGVLHRCECVSHLYTDKISVMQFYDARTVTREIDVSKFQGSGVCGRVKILSGHALGVNSVCRLGGGDKRRLCAKAIREQSFQIFDLRKIVDDDVRIRRIEAEEVLMIILGGVEALAAFDRRCDGLVEDVRSIELCNVGGRY